MSIPLPEPKYHVRVAGKELLGYTADQLHAHAAAVSAAKDAEIAGLRAELLREHADHKETVEDAATVVHQNTALRTDNTRLQNEVVMPLRERVRVLEEALADLLSLYDQRIPLRERPTTWDAARAALGDKNG